MKKKKSPIAYVIGIPIYLISTSLGVALSNWDWYNQGIHWLYFNLFLMVLGIGLLILLKYIFFKIKVKHKAKIEYKTTEKMKKKKEIKQLEREIKDESTI